MCHKGWKESCSVIARLQRRGRKSISGWTQAKREAPVQIAHLTPQDESGLRVLFFVSAAAGAAPGSAVPAPGSAILSPFNG